MVSFDLNFRSMLIEEIVEEEELLWNEGIISWLSINRGSYHGKIVKVYDGAFCTFGGVSVFSGLPYCLAGSWRISSIWLIVQGF